MIRVQPSNEPAAFDAECRQPGFAWLARNPGGDPRTQPLWRPFRAALREAFGRRCGFLGLRIPLGTVDHWLSIKSRPDLAYEWRNYRFVDGAINSAKKPSWEGKLVDPFEVEDEWFEIDLPSLQLLIAADLEPALRARVEFTLEKLHLRDGEDIIRLRREWLELYEARDLSLAGLNACAPLLARAVAKRDGLSLPAAAR